MDGQVVGSLRVIAWHGNKTCSYVTHHIDTIQWTQQASFSVVHPRGSSAKSVMGSLDELKIRMTANSSLL